MQNKKWFSLIILLTSYKIVPHSLQPIAVQAKNNHIFKFLKGLDIHKS